MSEGDVIKKIIYYWSRRAHDPTMATVKVVTDKSAKIKFGTEVEGSIYGQFVLK